MKITITTELDTAELYNAVLDMVTDAGCINYWASFHGAGTKYFTFINDEEGDNPLPALYTVTPSDLGRALEALLELGAGVDPVLRDSALAAARNDFCDVDADLADVLIQIACFNEIRYG